MSLLLKIGDVMNTRHPESYWPPSEWPLWILKHAIHDYQKAMFPKSTDKNSWWTTHSRTYLGNNMWLSCTSPKAIYEELPPDYIEKVKYPMSIARYKYIDSMDDIALKAFQDMANKLKGTPYDYLQLVGMALHELFPNLVTDHSSLVYANKNSVVCSVGVATCLIAMWKASDRTLPRPCGDPEANPNEHGGDGYYVEEIPPALFNNHPTFETIFKRNW